MGNGAAAQAAAAMSKTAAVSKMRREVIEMERIAVRGRILEGERL